MQRHCGYHCVHIGSISHTILHRIHEAAGASRKTTETWADPLFGREQLPGVSKTQHRHVPEKRTWAFSVEFPSSHSSSSISTRRISLKRRAPTLHSQQTCESFPLTVVRARFSLRRSSTLMTQCNDTTDDEHCPEETSLHSSPGTNNFGWPFTTGNIHKIFASQRIDHMTGVNGTACSHHLHQVQKVLVRRISGCNFSFHQGQQNHQVMQHTLH